jgi:hypothetical protein
LKFSPLKDTSSLFTVVFVRFRGLTSADFRILFLGVWFGKGILRDFRESATSAN